MHIASEPSSPFLRKRIKARAVENGMEVVFSEAIVRALHMEITTRGQTIVNFRGKTLRLTRSQPTSGISGFLEVVYFQTSDKERGGATLLFLCTKLIRML